MRITNISAEPVAVPLIAGGAVSIDPGATKILGDDEVSPGARFLLERRGVIAPVVAGEVDVQGIQGQTGVQGYPGIDGLQGTTGVDGPIGATGIQGIWGVTGPPGYTGVPGVTGAIGATGVRGLVGSGGNPGTTGATGVQGATGAGIQGLTGATGVQGTTGVQGATGAGIQGLTGATGVQGVQGITGTWGITGATGAGIQGATGVTGVQGATGVQGSTVGLAPLAGPSFTGTVTINSATTFDTSGYGFVRPVTFVLGAGADVATGTDLTNWVLVPRAGKFIKCFINAKTAPTGASLVVDIMKSSNNGTSFTSLWNSTPADRPTLTSGTTAATVTSFDTTACAEGDLLRIDVITVGSTVAGQWVVVTLLALLGNN